MKIVEGQILARAIRRVLECEGELRCAVAFWGPQLAAQAAARSAKIVLDISMGGTSRNALTALGVPGNRNVRVLNGLHAKIYISPHCAILTSANASRNALGGGDVCPALKEAGVLIDRFEYPAAYESMERLFARYWKAGHVAEAADFERAVKVSLIVAARDRCSSGMPLGSVLDQLAVSPDMFARTSFIFGDARLTPKELTIIQEAYADDRDSTGDGTMRQLICATRDREEARVLEECSYVIMYWLGQRKGIRAFHDVVRVEANNELTAFYGRRQWSTVRSRIGLTSVMTSRGYWEADSPRAEVIADRSDEDVGDRFVILRYDELHELLERGLLE